MSPLQTGKIICHSFPFSSQVLAIQRDNSNGMTRVRDTCCTLCAEMGTPESARRNLATARIEGRIRLWRSPAETQIVKQIIWHCRGKRSQRALARDLGVSQQYVCKVLKQSAPALVGRQPTFADLFKARQAARRNGASLEFHPTPEHPSLKQAESTLAAKRLPRASVYHHSFTVPLPDWARWK